MRRSTVLELACIALVVAASGCGDSSVAGRPELFPVSGRVLVGGKPAAGVTVNFHPQSPTGTPPLVPSATTESDGSFHVRTFAPADGAPAGDYLVTASWWTNNDGGDDKPSVDRLRGRYSDPSRSPLKVPVAAGPNELKPFVLK